MEIDVHGMSLIEAIDDIFFEIDDLRGTEIREFSMIYGFHTGTVLKNYFNSQRFIQEMKQYGIILRKTGNPNRGKTKFEIILCE